MQTPAISIGLNSDTFVLTDSEELVDRLCDETGLRVQGEVEAFASVGGDPLAPDVVLYILYSLLPLKDIYASVLSSLLVDKAKAVFSRQGREDTEATYTVVTIDEDRRTLSKLTVKTSDPKIIKHLMC